MSIDPDYKMPTNVGEMIERAHKFFDEIGAKRGPLDIRARDICWHAELGRLLRERYGMHLSPDIITSVFAKADVLLVLLNGNNQDAIVRAAKALRDSLRVLDPSDKRRRGNDHQ